MSGALAAFFDPVALAIVALGTALATFARCSPGDLTLAMRGVRDLALPGFDEDANRAALARMVPEVRERGPLCADVAEPPDPELATLMHRYLSKGMIEIALNEARLGRSRRENEAERAVLVFENAGELAPVFGLVGTLIGIAQLMPVQDLSENAITLSAVGSAVLSTLYGVILAHLICVPLARRIERRLANEEHARAHLLEWFAAEVERGRPTTPTRLRDAA